MPTTLCLDFGNTRLKAAVFTSDQLSEIIHLRHESTEHLTQIINQYQPRCSILSSVIDHSPEIEILLTAKTDFHKLSHLSKLPFSIPVGKPETVGTDRLAIAAGAVHFYPRRNNLIIALGSCITYNFINSAHELIGGSISPGTEIRFKSLNDYTAKLPLVKGNWNVPLIGYDTLTNIQSGVILGMAKEINGIVDSYNERFGNFNAVLTGGDLPFIAPHIKKEIFADPEILFKGLYAISQINHT
ncbi:MAG TPA: type III pantothenate kinase [Chitinophagaceae bacterium]|nr:type III pantothenate kinase [Chitinophagaceae bacterium]